MRKATLSRIPDHRFVQRTYEANVHCTSPKKDIVYMRFSKFIWWLIDLSEYLSTLNQRFGKMRTPEMGESAFWTLIQGQLKLCWCLLKYKEWWQVYGKGIPSSIWCSLESRVGRGSEANIWIPSLPKQNYVQTLLILNTLPSKSFSY